MRLNRRGVIAGGAALGASYWLPGAAQAGPIRLVAEAGDAPLVAPANPVARPDLAAAEEHRLVFEGGAMGGMRGAMMGGRMMDMRELVKAGRIWAVNGVAPADLIAEPPMLSLGHGRAHVVTLENRTSWPHPIHLHGHSFHVLRDGPDPLEGAEIRDTVLLFPDETARIALVADNPGKWMLHCHILEHQVSGMMGVVEVA